ncbi:MAG: DUF2076 domain-containing protein [Rhodomicrobium sp.]
MTPEERQLLSALAQRVKTVPPQQKDPEAEQFIRQLVMERPDTPYVLAQTVIMQDFALRNAQSQIEDLQRQMSEMAPPAQERPGSFLGGLFGRSPSPQPSTSSSGSVPRVNPWGNPDMPPPGYGGAPGQGQGYGAPPGQGQGYGAPPGQGYGTPPQGPVMQPAQTGSFLRGAASTAVGVAGGALLFQGINSLFSGHHGFSNSALAGVNPQDSLSEKTIANNSYDQGSGGGLQQADFGGDAADYGDDADFGGDDDQFA